MCSFNSIVDHRNSAIVLRMHGNSPSFQFYSRSSRRGEIYGSNRSIVVFQFYSRSSINIIYIEKLDYIIIFQFYSRSSFITAFITAIGEPYPFNSIVDHRRSKNYSHTSISAECFQFYSRSSGVSGGRPKSKNVHLLSIL